MLSTDLASLFLFARNVNHHLLSHGRSSVGITIYCRVVRLVLATKLNTTDDDVETIELLQEMIELLHALFM
eukprot:scaffold137958_cov34-Tisochrysis_lutea.AAC.3